MTTQRDGARRCRRAAPARIAVAIAAMLSWAHVVPAAAGGITELPPLQVVADGVPVPLATAPGDAGRGRSLLVARESANCVLCHIVPDSDMRFAGDVGPSLAGVGARFSVPQLRLRVADNLRVSPSSVMPSYYKVAGLDRVAAQYAGRPILTGAEVEDVVAYLSTLR